MGSLSLPQELARKIMSGLYGLESDKGPTEQLTKRELDVLKGIAHGMSNAEIAQDLSISVTTVRSHVHSLLRKLNLSSRTQAALYAVEIGLVTPTERNA